MKLDNYKVGIFVAVAAVLGVMGTLTFTNFQTESQESNFQTVGIGSDVTVDVYNKEGNLYYKWEDHNELTSSGIETLVQCYTTELCDLDDRNPEFILDKIIEIDDEIVFDSSPISSDKFSVNPMPAGCLEEVSVFCTGWSIEVVLLTSDLCIVVEDDHHCYQILNASFDRLNRIEFEPPIEPILHDTVIITMNFTIPK